MSTTTYEVPTHCEEHAAAGACTVECAAITNMMTEGYGGESMVYSDYLGGTSSIDVSGCHGARPGPEVTFVFDAEARAVRMRTVHPEDCGCKAHGPADEGILCPECGGDGNPFCPVCGGDGGVMAVVIS